MIRYFNYCSLLFIILISCSKPKLIPPSPEGILVKDGFIVEKLYNPGEKEQGSWVSITKDDQGRLISSDQYGDLYYIDVPKLGSSDSVKVEAFPLDIGNAHGLLWAYNSLYVMQNANKQEESGLYRITDSNNDGALDSITFLQQFKGRGEHGPHGLVLGPDGYIYMSGGNHTDLPETFESIQKPIWDEDQLFPLIKDPRGHANDILAPGGWVARSDENGKNFTVIATGFRNAYDLAFNSDDELFTFDSDMEWDMGSSWYRPIRVCHITPGAEFGWRTGSGKWPASYPDNLPSVLDIGQGSPTGLVAGQDLAFPEYYQSGIFVFDWSFGTMYFVDLKAEGSSYSGTKEEFLSGMPLPLTDGVAGDDGAMYFVTGGRRLESGLYRVYHKDILTANQSKSQNLTEENKLRRKLEKYASSDLKGDLDLIWQSLKHEDRRIRYTARVALEYQELNDILMKFKSETNAITLINSSIALARIGDQKMRSNALNKLQLIGFEELNSSQQIDLIRAINLLFIRGSENVAAKDKIKKHLGNNYPTKNNDVNKELVQLLAYVDDAKVVDKTLHMLDTLSVKIIKAPIISDDVIQRSSQYGGIIERMKNNAPPSELMHYVKALSYASKGWTPELQKKYFRYFNKLFAANGGESYTGFLVAIRDDALINVPESERENMKAISGEELKHVKATELADLPQPKGPGNNWTVQDIVEIVSVDENQNLENGKRMFQAALCSSCHAIGGSGSSVGPDLTQLTSRFSSKDIAEALVSPNSTISDQYTAVEIVLQNDRQYWGRVIEEKNDTLWLNQNPMNPDNIRKIPISKIKSKINSDRSIMYPGLLNRLNEEEIKDLFSYMKSQARTSKLN